MIRERKHLNRGLVGDSVKYALHQIEADKLLDRVKEVEDAWQTTIRISKSLIYKLRSTPNVRTTEQTIDVLAECFDTEWIEREIPLKDSNDKVFEFPRYSELELMEGLRKASPKLKELSDDDISTIGIDQFLKIINDDAIDNAISDMRQVRDIQSQAEYENYRAEEKGGTIPVITCTGLHSKSTPLNHLLAESVIKLIPRNVQVSNDTGKRNEWFGLFPNMAEQVDRFRNNYGAVIKRNSVFILNKNPDMVNVGDRVMLELQNGNWDFGTLKIKEDDKHEFSILDRVSKQTGLEDLVFISDIKTIKKELDARENGDEPNIPDDQMLSCWYKIVGWFETPFGDTGILPF